MTHTYKRALDFLRKASSNINNTVTSEVVETTVTSEVVEEKVRPITWSGEPSVLRVYCSGTLFDEENKGELIAGLYNGDPGTDKVDKLHLKGPGKAKHSSVVTGTIDGYADMKGNVRTATEWLYRRIYEEVKKGNHNIVIPISGWSRGAVTTFWIANQIENVKLRVLNDIIKNNELDLTPDGVEFLQNNLNVTAKILVVDPVPGPTNLDGTMLGDMSRSSRKKDNRTQMQVVTPNVTEINVLYAEDEKRSIMQPIVPKLLSEQSTVRAQTLPGSHIDLVRPQKVKKGSQNNDQPASKRYDETFMAVAYFADSFYRKNGIVIDMEQALFEFASNRSGNLIDGVSRLDAIAFLIQQEARLDRPENMTPERQHVVSHEQWHNEDYSACLMKDYLDVNYPLLSAFMGANDTEFQENLSNAAMVAEVAKEWQAFSKEVRDSNYETEFSDKFGTNLLDEQRLARIDEAAGAIGYTDEDIDDEDVSSSWRP